MTFSLLPIFYFKILEMFILYNYIRELTNQIH
jgi:hypothetical protein